MTPLAIGTPIMFNTRHDSNTTRTYSSETCEQYLIQDLQHHRVFVDMEIFMKHVLHVPDNWREVWGPTIERIKRTDAFSNAHHAFTTCCNTKGSREEGLYSPLVAVSNAILDACESPEADNSVNPVFGLRYLRNDTGKVGHGMLNKLLPDVVTVHKDFLPSLSKQERSEMRIRHSKLTWANTLQSFEIKPFDTAIVDGSCMPRLKVNGESTATMVGKQFY
jgi:hypothetical protein